jgi:hypothetical protein
MSGDPGATIASPRKSPGRVAVPVAPPPPAQVYSGQVASGPTSSPAPAQKSNITFILIGVGVLFSICLCVAFFWYVDANYLWCTIFPFLGGC